MIKKRSENFSSPTPFQGGFHVIDDKSDMGNAGPIDSSGGALRRNRSASENLFIEPGELPPILVNHVGPSKFGADGHFVASCLASAGQILVDRDARQASGTSS